jgi:uncharacterized protein
VWTLTEADLEPISIGAALLGTGGGGNPYLGKLRVRQLLREGLRVDVIKPDDVADDDFLVVSGAMGSPVVSYEKLARGTEEADAARALQEHLGRPFTAIAPFEMGGGNSFAAMAVAAHLGVPVVDGDGMGRAFPELQMITYLIYGGAPAPAALADEKGNAVILPTVVDAKWLERISRAVTIEMGGHTGLAACVMDGRHCRDSIIPGTLTYADQIGRAIQDARATKEDPVEATLEITGGYRHIRGKVVDVERRMSKGFARGHVTIEGFGPDAGREATIEFQNENLVIIEEGEAQAVVPDLISLVTTERADPITTEVVRYGLRTDVLVLPAPDMLTTPRALEVVGPRAFGLDHDFRSAFAPSSHRG